MTSLKLFAAALILATSACAGAYEPLPADDIAESRDADLHRHAQYGDR